MDAGASFTKELKNSWWKEGLYTCLSDSHIVAPGPAASVSLGKLLKMQIFSLNPDLLSQNLEGGAQ